MPNRKFLVFLENLIAATRKSAVRWSTTADPAAFRLVLSKGLVRIQYFTAGEDDWGAPYPAEYVVSLTNEAGQVVEEYRASQQDLDRMKERTYEGIYILVDDLFQAARSSALDADEIIDSMIQDLNKE